MSGFCPFPLVIPENPNSSQVIPGTAGAPGLGANGCALPCQGSMSAAVEVETFDVLTTIFSSIGIVLGTFMVLTWGIFQAKEKQKITFWLSVTTFMITFAQILGVIVSGGKPSANWCVDNTDPNTQVEGGICVYQGISLVFFALSANCWWFVSCFDLFSKLVQNKRNIDHYLKYYHIFCWGLATICTAGLAIAGQFGFFAPRVWCFLGPGSEISEWIGFYAWVALLWFVGTILMVSVIGTLIRRIAKVEGGSSSPAMYFKYLTLYKQPLIFVFAFSFVWAVFVTFRLTTLDVETFEAAAVAWVQCLLLNLQLGKFSPHNDPTADTSTIDGFIPADITIPGSCGEVQPNRISKELLGLSVVLLSSSSTIIFLIFGLHRENFRLWKNLLCPPKSELVFDSSASQIKTNDGRNQSYGGQSFNGASVTRPPLSGNAESALSNLGAVTSTFGKLFYACVAPCGITPKVKGPDRNIRPHFEQTNNYDPRYMFNMDEDNRGEAVSNDVANLSYDDWEKQFLVDPLWGIN